MELSRISHTARGIKQAAPGKFASKIVLSAEYLGIAVRPNLKELTDWVNDFITRHEQAGTVNALYTKWVGTDRPDMPAFMDGIPFSVE